jgi:4a-hydroxytetrahydrobiopterin dehydratase
LANALAELSCVSVASDDSRATAEEIAAYMELLPGWRIIEVHGMQRLRRDFQFDDFAAALSFTTAVGRLAERENHHPATVTGHNRVTVTIWTFVLRALHRNDFILAAKIDQVAEQAQF